MSLKKLLITGGAGYIGSVLTRVLLEKGFYVSVLDNMSYGVPSLIELCGNDKFDFIKGDVRNELLMKKLIAEYDIIIPLAALVGAPLCEERPQESDAVNFKAIKFIADNISKNQNVIFPTTNSGYGTKDGSVYCTEETPLEPISLYGKGKVAAEKTLLDTGNSITLRLATVFGTSPRMRTDLLVNNFVFEAFFRRYLVIFQKDFKRNYIHIRDVADCFLHCINNYDSMKGEPYNAGLDEANLSKEKLALEIKKEIPDFYIHFAEIGEDKDKRNYIVSNKKLEQKGFKAKRTVKHGIKELIKAYRMISFKNHLRNY